MNYREKWRALLERRLGPQGLGDVIDILDRDGLFKGWNRLWTPGAYAVDQLAYAVEIRCGDPAHPYAKTFLEYAVAIARRAYGETERWSPTGDWGDPNGAAGIRRGLLVTAKAVADGLDTDGEPDQTELVEAARAMIKESLGLPGWNEYSQSYYLLGVLLLLIAGEVTEAKTAMSLRKRFRDTKLFHAWLGMFVASLPREEAPCLRDTKAVSHFERMFDTVRNPDWAPDWDDPTTGYSQVTPHCIA